MSPWVAAAVADFRRRRLAVGAGACLGLLWATAVAAPLIASERPLLWKDASGWSAPWLFGLFDRNEVRDLDLAFNLLLLTALPIGLALWRRPRASTLGVAAVVQLLLTVGAILLDHREAAFDWANAPRELALFPPIASGPSSVDLGRALLPPSADHWLGTDGAGCDVGVRLLYGTRISLSVGVVAVALYCGFGTVFGAVAGYFGGRVDLVLQRIIEVVICVPPLFMVLSLTAFVDQPGLFQMMLAIAAVAWTGPARLVRAEVMRLRSLDFVAAARAAGFSDRRIILEEILPNALAPVLVSATFGVAASILVESTLGFLGRGDPGAPSWGQLLATGRQHNLWSLILAPGFAIFFTVSVLNLVGEGLRDALDPRLRGA